jgi:hypothetical protein
MRWENEARQLLKAEIVRKGLTYERLAKALQAIGIAETPRSIANKISRGSFSFVFFLQCLRALGAETVTIQLPQASAQLPSAIPDVDLH